MLNGASLPLRDRKQAQAGLTDTRHNGINIAVRSDSSSHAELLVNCCLVRLADGSSYLAGMVSYKRMATRTRHTTHPVILTWL